MPHTHSLSIELTSDANNISQVEAYVEQVKMNCNVSEDLYGNILISLTEAVNNAIIHGNKEDKSKSVSVLLYEKSNVLIFHIKDQGEGFKFDEIPDPTTPENLMMEGGRGVFLMRQLADRVQFHDNGSTVELRFAC